jgi:hypothetical protein
MEYSPIGNGKWKKKKMKITYSVNVINSCIPLHGDFFYIFISSSTYYKHITHTTVLQYNYYKCIYVFGPDITQTHTHARTCMYSTHIYMYIIHARILPEEAPPRLMVSNYTINYKSFFETIQYINSIVGQ